MQYILTQEEYDALVNAEKISEAQAMERVKQKIHDELNAYHQTVCVALSKALMDSRDGMFYDSNSWPPSVAFKGAYIKFKEALNYKI